MIMTRVLIIQYTVNVYVVAQELGPETVPWQVMAVRTLRRICTGPQVCRFRWSIH